MPINIIPQTTLVEEKITLSHMNSEKTLFSQRFRGYLPVVVDIETSGFDPLRNAYA